MPKEREKTVTMFCTHCGETKTYVESNPLSQTEGRACKECMQGTLIRSIPISPEQS